MLDPKVFKAYDVRGIYPDELDEAGAYAIGRAYVDEFEPRRIAVGRDMRLSSPAMADAVSPKTVATHVQRILTKLDVHSRAEAVAFAHREGLTRPPA